MSIIACGINHKTAQIELREKMVFPQEKLALYLQDLSQNENIREAVLLSTCNRSELYCDTDDIQKLTDWFCRHHQLVPAELSPALYFYRDAEAVQHIMHVACGLDSMVLGESQILSQMKDAFSESCAAGTVGTLFNRLFQQVFAVAKEVRTNTAVGACPVSVSSAAVSFIKENFKGPLHDANVLLIGTGVTMDLVMRHLGPLQPNDITIVNRSAENASQFAKKYQVNQASMQNLPNTLAKADIVISATGSTLPIIQKTMLDSRQKPIFIVDIAVPRDVEASARELKFVKLFSIDDLKSIIQKNMRGREHAADKAREVIKQQTEDFMSWLHSLDLVATTICAYRKQIEDLCANELSKSLRQLKRGEDPVEVLNLFARALTQKLLHTPTVQLRQAGFEGRIEILQLAQQLFAIPDLELL
ncbi:MAG TPA: glutamyl-tRNA reductase [Gammaproteobacteria bacterium]|nr:glutamyl-tRNA reductase [Gammaproteobacteria bacterium]